MIRFTMFRTVAVFTLIVGLFITLPGCSGDKPKPDEKKDKDKKDGNNLIDPNANKGDPGTPVKPPEKVVDFNTGVGKEAMDFVKSISDGSVKAEQKLSTPFLKAIGLPLDFDGDRMKGYSADNAEGWLKKVVVGFGVPFPSTQVGDVALIRGGLNGGGGYAIRLVKDGAAWKVDFLGLTSAQLSGSTSAGTGEAALQAFTAVSFAELLADKTAMPKEERAMATAALMTPALRAKWGDPVFEDDRKKGYDYNRAALVRKIGEIGEAESLSCTQQGDTPAFKVEFTKGGMKKAYLLKLEKDGTGRWLVADVTPQ